MHTIANMRLSTTTPRGGTVISGDSHFVTEAETQNSHM